MKIDNSVKTLPGIAPVGEGQSRPRSGTTAAPSSGNGADVVELSPLSAQIKAIEDRLAGAEVADSAKVAEIKAAISEGRFKVNPEAIADKLIETARELLAARKDGA